MRLPRKYKKQVKKKVAGLVALRNLKCAIVAASSSIQVATISAQPRRMDIPQPAWVAQRALQVADITLSMAEVVGKILSEKPNHWRDFVR